MWGVEGVQGCNKATNCTPPQGWAPLRLKQSSAPAPSAPGAFYPTTFSPHIFAQSQIIMIIRVKKSRLLPPLDFRSESFFDAFRKNYFSLWVL